MEITISPTRPFTELEFRELADLCQKNGWSSPSREEDGEGIFYYLMEPHDLPPDISDEIRDWMNTKGITGDVA